MRRHGTARLDAVPRHDFKVHDVVSCAFFLDSRDIKVSSRIDE